MFVCNFFEIWTLCSITKNHLALVLKKLIDYWLTIPNAICTVITIYQKLFFMKCWFISKPSVQLPSGSTISISIKGSSFHNSEMTKVFWSRVTTCRLVIIRIYIFLQESLVQIMSKFELKTPEEKYRLHMSLILVSLSLVESCMTIVRL